MSKQRTGPSLIFWLPALCLALVPLVGAVDDEASVPESLAAPSNAASLLPANTPPTLKALGGAVRPGGRLVLSAYATDADSSLVQLLATLHPRPGQPAPAWGSVTEHCKAELDHAYKLATAAPSAPSGGTGTENHTPTGWQRAQPSPTATENVYRAERTEYYEGGSFSRAGAWGGVAKVGDKLTVDAGGPYVATAYQRAYVARVEASASGGTSPYTFRWQDQNAHNRANSRANAYVFVSSGTYTRSVTVTDANGHQKSSSAKIICTPSNRVGGSSDEGRSRVPVPLGGALVAVWGNGGLISASSEDAGVAVVAVNGSEIAITGVSSGETSIVVQTGGGEYRVPIRVGGE